MNKFTNYFKNVVNEAYAFGPQPPADSQYVWILIGEGQREGEEHVMAVYSDPRKAKETYMRFKKEGYGDHEDFRLEKYPLNFEPF
jgi:hypothetical protein